MIPIMMINEIPLPRPRSVIRSPNHITNKVEQVRITMLVNNQNWPSGRAPASMVA